jgi:hypothetical protein
VRLTLPPGGEQTVQFELDGVVSPGPTYRLTVVGQPLLHAGTIDVDVRRPRGADGRGSDRAVGHRTVSEAEDATIEFDMDRS